MKYKVLALLLAFAMTGCSAASQAVDQIKNDPSAPQSGTESTPANPSQTIPALPAAKPESTQPSETPKAPESTEDPLIWTNEEELLKLLEGEWSYRDFITGEEYVWINIDQEGNYTAELEVPSDHARHTYSGVCEFDSYSTENDIPDSFTLKLLETDDPILDLSFFDALGDFMITNKTLCENELVLELLQMNNGDTIFSIYFEDYYPVLRKKTELPTISEPRKDDSFLAIAWKLDAEKHMIWLDDCALDGILLPEGRNEAVPYQISENIDLGPLFYDWSNNLICEVATDENGVVKEIMVFHESYGDGFTEEDAMAVLEAYETVQVQLNEGMVMEKTGETLEIDGIVYYIIAVGTNNNGTFTAEHQYAASNLGDALYYDPAGDAWVEVGFG